MRGGEGGRGFTHQCLVHSQVHGSVQWERRLYTCSNQLANSTCLSGSFTPRHTHMLTEVGETQWWMRRWRVAA